MITFTNQHCKKWQITTMCEFQIAYPKKIPMCEYTKGICDFCVCGNKKTYNEAIKNKEERSDNNV